MKRFKRTKVKKGVKTRSGFETKVLKDLDKRKIIYSYESDSFEYIVSRSYTPDIKIKGKDFFVEIKGRFLSKDRSTLKALKKQKPHLEIRILFQRNNKLNRNSKTRYTDWAKKEGFICHVGESIPEEWLN